MFACTYVYTHAHTHTHTHTHIHAHTHTHTHTHTRLGRYGVTEFIVLAPEEGSDALTSEAQANLMLSTVSIALNNTSW